MHIPSFIGKPKPIVPFCGRCHGAVETEFSAGRHARLPPGEVLDCLECHEHHKTEKADIDKIQRTCFRCHKEKDPIRKKVIQITVSLNKVRKELFPEMRNELEAHEFMRKIPGVDLQAEDAKVEAAKKIVSGMREIQHGLTLTRLEDAQRQVQGQRAALSAALVETKAQTDRRPVYLVVFLILWLGAGAWAARVLKKRGP